MAELADEPFALGEYLDQLVDKLRSLLPRAVRKGESGAIHESRVATRRLKAAVDLFSPVVVEKHASAFKRTLRRLRRSLGPLRDHDVMLGHLEKIRVGKANAPGVEWMIERLRDGRKRAEKEATREIDPSRALAKLGAWWGIREELFAARDSVDRLLSDSVHAQLNLFRGRADQMAGLPGSGEDAHVKFDPHELRIAGKALRYTLEMARAQGHDLPLEVIRTFKKMQDALGLWHDYVVLAEQCMRLSADEMLAHHDADLQDAVMGLARAILAKSRQQLSKFGTLWQQNGPSLTESVEAAFPCQAEAIALQTDHDPENSGESSSPEVLPEDSPEGA